jgi:hypothetical protein
MPIFYNSSITWYSRAWAPPKQESLLASTRAFTRPNSTPHSLFSIVLCDCAAVQSCRCVSVYVVCGLPTSLKKTANHLRHNTEEYNRHLQRHDNVKSKMFSIIFQRTQWASKMEHYARVHIGLQHLAKNMSSWAYEGLKVTHATPQGCFLQLHEIDQEIGTLPNVSHR